MKILNISIYGTQDRYMVGEKRQNENTLLYIQLAGANSTSTRN